MNNKENEQTHTNMLISQKDFSYLTNLHDQHCISLYIPTSRAGEEVDRNHGQIRLKNSLKDLKIRLKEYNLSNAEIESYLSPIDSLLDDSQFWREQSDCLVIFLSNEQMKYYTLPITQDVFTYVSDHFYLLPIIPLFSGDGKYYILSLSLQSVRLFENTRHSISEIYVEDLVPEKLEEVVGYDYQNKNLQFRSGQGRNNGAMFHGQGAGKDDKEIEIEKFIRAVDDGLMKIINDEDATLILACVDHYQPIFVEITSYANIFPKNISGNHEETDPFMLHELSWDLIKDYFKQDRREITNLIRDSSADGKTSFDLNNIIPAAIDGRVEILFIRSDKDKFGLYDKVNRTLIIDEKLKISQASLYNMAAVQTIIKAGKVFIVEKEEMPFKDTDINALFRY